VGVLENVVPPVTTVPPVTVTAPPIVAPPLVTAKGPPTANKPEVSIWHVRGYGVGTGAQGGRWQAGGLLCRHRTGRANTPLLQQR
jgi:hypothetical protein